MPRYFELTTGWHPDRVAETLGALADGSLVPVEAKRLLARTIADLYHGEGAGAAAEAEFDRVFKAHATPSDVPDREVDASEFPLRLAHLLNLVGLVPSNKEGRRKIEQGGRAHRRGADHRSRPRGRRRHGGRPARPGRQAGLGPRRRQSRVRMSERHDRADEEQRADDGDDRAGHGRRVAETHDVHDRRALEAGLLGRAHLGHVVVMDRPVALALARSLVGSSHGAEM